MDASWGLQLQLQAWPVPNRRIQPWHAELDPENPSRPPDRHWPNCKRGGGEPSRVRAWVLGSKERPGAARSHVRGVRERPLRAAACGAAATAIERLQSGRFPATPAGPAAGV